MFYMDKVGIWLIQMYLLCLFSSYGLVFHSPRSYIPYVVSDGYYLLLPRYIPFVFSEGYFTGCSGTIGDIWPVRMEKGNLKRINANRI